MTTWKVGGKEGAAYLVGPFRSWVISFPVHAVASGSPRGASHDKMSPIGGHLLGGRESHFLVSFLFFFLINFLIGYCVVIYFFFFSKRAFRADVRSIGATQFRAFFAGALALRTVTIPCSPSSVHCR